MLIVCWLQKRFVSLVNNRYFILHILQFTSFIGIINHTINHLKASIFMAHLNTGFEHIELSWIWILAGFEACSAYPTSKCLLWSQFGGAFIGRMLIEVTFIIHTLAFRSKIFVDLNVRNCFSNHQIYYSVSLGCVCKWCKVKKTLQLTFTHFSASKTHFFVATCDITL